MYPPDPLAPHHETHHRNAIKRRHLIERARHQAHQAHQPLHRTAHSHSPSLDAQRLKREASRAAARHLVEAARHPVAGAPYSFTANSPLTPWRTAPPSGGNETAFGSSFSTLTQLSEQVNDGLWHAAEKLRLPNYVAIPMALGSGLAIYIGLKPAFEQVVPAAKKALAVASFASRLQSDTSPPHGSPSSFDFHGSTTSDFRAAIAEAYEGMSPEVRQFLENSGTRVSVGATQTQIEPERGLAYRTPTGADSRIHWNQVGGLFDPAVNRLTVSQLEYDIDQKPALGSEPTFRGIAKGKWTVVSNERAKDVLRHETGHAFSHNNGQTFFHDRRLSDAPEFKSAWQADIEALGGKDEAIKKGWGYFARYDLADEGREEVMAEGWAALNGGGSRGTKILTAFPKATEWIKQYEINFRAAFNRDKMAGIHELTYDTFNYTPPTSLSETELSQLDHAARERIAAHGQRPEIAGLYDDIMGHIPVTPETATLRHAVAHSVVQSLGELVFLDGEPARDLKVPHLEDKLGLPRSIDQMEVLARQAGLTEELSAKVAGLVHDTEIAGTEERSRVKKAYVDALAEEKKRRAEGNGGEPEPHADASKPESTSPRASLETQGASPASTLEPAPSPPSAPDTHTAAPQAVAPQTVPPQTDAERTSTSLPQAEAVRPETQTLGGEPAAQHPTTRPDTQAEAHQVSPTATTAAAPAPSPTSSAAPSSEAVPHPHLPSEVTERISTSSSPIPVSRETLSKPIGKLLGSVASSAARTLEGAAEKLGLPGLAVAGAIGGVTALSQGANAHEVGLSVLDGVVPGTKAAAQGDMATSSREAGMAMVGVVGTVVAAGAGMAAAPAVVVGAAATVVAGASYEAGHALGELLLGPPPENHMTPMTFSGPVHQIDLVSPLSLAIDPGAATPNGAVGSCGVEKNPGARRLAMRSTQAAADTSAKKPDQNALPVEALPVRTNPMSSASMASVDPAISTAPVSQNLRTPLSQQPPTTRPTPPFAPV